MAIGLTEALVDAAADKDDDVRDSITKSIVDIGRKKHTQVLTILHNYLSKRNKVGVAQWNLYFVLIAAIWLYYYIACSSSSYNSVEADGEDL